MPPHAVGKILVSSFCWYHHQVPDVTWASYNKVGVFRRASGRMYFASVELDRCLVCSMMTWRAPPTLAPSVQSPHANYAPPLTLQLPRF